MVSLSHFGEGPSDWSDVYFLGELMAFTGDGGWNHSENCEGFRYGPKLQFLFKG